MDWNHDHVIGALVTKCTKGRLAKDRLGPITNRDLRESDKGHFHFVEIDMISGEIDGNWLTRFHLTSLSLTS